MNFGHVTTVLLWTDRMGASSKCTIVRAMSRPVNALEALSGRNRTQNHTISS